MTLPRPVTAEERVAFLRYTDPDRWPAFGRFPVGDRTRDDVLAAMMAGETVDVTVARSSLERDRDRCAAELMADATFVDTVRQLPFGPGDRVVAVGDSITADRLGWFELVVDTVHRLDGPHPTFVNTAVSGDTTADAVARFDLLEAARPSHVLLMLGTNDARGHGRGARRTMASLAETARNLAVLAELVTVELGSDLVVFTPPACDGRRAARHFADLPLGWSPADVDAVAEVVRGLGVACVDVHRFTADRVAGDAYDDDGVHLSPTGQVDLARFVVARLAADRAPVG